ncbi:hypothetical protein BJ742DRAFT_845247 [Cladochytrium replicatum]|nr:hypothetical protein BJ742DRAFT_845247 [Cladochytrium replicatum]
MPNLPLKKPDSPSPLLRLPDFVWRKVFTLYLSPLQVYGALLPASVRFRSVLNTINQCTLVNLILIPTPRAHPIANATEVEDASATPSRDGVAPSTISAPPAMTRSDSTAPAPPTIIAPARTPTRTIRLPTENGRTCTIALPEVSESWARFDASSFERYTVDPASNKAQSDTTKERPQVLHSGEFITVTIPLVDVPTDRQKLHAMIRNWLAAVLLIDLAVSKEESTSAPSPVAASLLTRHSTAVIWEVRINPRKWIETDAHHTRSLLSTLHARFVTVYYPPSTIFRLLPPTLQALRLEYVSDGLDLTGIERLTSLTRLELEGPVGGLMYNNEPPEDVYPDQLEPLVHLAPTLEDLRIGRWFPVTDYTPLCESILPKLTNLRRFYTRGFFQGDQSPSLLAKMVASWPKIQMINNLGDIDNHFWSSLRSELRSKNLSALPNLITFTIEFSEPEPDIDAIVAAAEAVLTTLTAVVCVRVLFTNLGNGSGKTDTVSCESIIEKVAGYLKDKIRRRILWFTYGVRVSLTDGAAWSEFNLESNYVKVGFRPPKDDYLLRLDDPLVFQTM